MDHSKKKRRSLIIAALVVCLAAVTGLGTLAWLTAQDSKTNTFTIGSFGEPDNPPETDGGNDEDKNPNDEETISPDGYLFETEWVDDSKLVPGVDVPKNPNVGIKTGGDNAYVFLYVKSDTIDGDQCDEEGEPGYGQVSTALAPYFTVEKQWLPVKDASSNTLAHESTAEGVSNAYIDGLFMYVEDGTSEPAPTLPAALDLADAQEGDDEVFTGELFETVTAPNGVDTRVYKTGANITVYAFLYSVDAGADGTATPSPEDGSAQAAVIEAIDWAEGLGWKLS